MGKQVCGKKGGSSATVRIGDGTEVQLFAVHTEHRNPDVRYATVQDLLKQVGSMPSILAGDFNSSPTGFPDHSKTKGGENAIDSILVTKKFETRPLNTLVKSEFTFPTNDPVRVIDWVFASQHFKIINYEVIQSDLSDHFPLKVTLELRSEAN